MGVKEYYELLQLLVDIENEYHEGHKKSDGDLHEKKFNFYAIGVTRKIKKRIKSKFKDRIR